MSSNNKIHKGEQAIIDMGVYVALPINMNILLTQNERDVLNVIRHCNNNGERYISNSVFRIMTGMAENTIRKARDSLIKLGIIEKGKTTTIGTEYKVNFKNLCTMVKNLNGQRNPVKRLALADKLRGAGQEINKQLIEEFRNTEFNNE